MMEKMRNKKKKGFTLIELIVVIAILAILALLAVPRLTSSRDRANWSAHAANIRTIESAVMMYQAETGNMPADIDDLVDGYLASVPSGPGSAYTINAAGEFTGTPTKADTEAALEADDTPSFD